MVSCASERRVRTRIVEERMLWRFKIVVRAKVEIKGEFEVEDEVKVKGRGVGDSGQLASRSLPSS